MSTAKRNQDYVTTAMGVSSADGTTPINLRVDPVTHYLLIEVMDSTTSGAIAGVSLAKHDENHIPVTLGISSSDSTLLQALRTHNGFLAVALN